MTIDIFSMIIGGILWELLSAYIYCVIKPKINKWRNDQKQNKDENKAKKSERYKDTTIGFTDETK